GLATAASRTTNPILLLLIAAVVAYVVAARRTDAPWARGFKVYVYLGLVVVAVRVVFRVLLDSQPGEHILFTLPELPLPDAAAGISIGGPVSLEGVLAAVYDGLRLAVLLLCVGAANVLANPKRLLASLPAALHEIGVAVTVAISVAPQLIESGQRVRAARRLRGEAGPRWHVFREVALPVMTDALDRSLLLAAAMDARGYGRAGAVPRRTRVATSALLLGGLVAIAIGTYGLLDSTAPRSLGLPMLFGGVAVGWAGVVLSGRRVSRSRYRPDPWVLPEWGVAGIGALVAVVFVRVSMVDPSDLYPSLEPLEWPTLPLLPALAVGVGALPAWLAPPTRATEPRRAAAPRPLEQVA
ncbi:MAG: energy-coupling factor transporter transmembrane protein EcfT, partial [Acidimicrobiales bacterium]